MDGDDDNEVIVIIAGKAQQPLSCGDSSSNSQTIVTATFHVIKSL